MVATAQPIVDAVPTPSPALSDTSPLHRLDHNALLAAFLSPALTLLAICEHHSITPTDLAAWVDAPRTRADLAALAHVAELRAAAITTQSKPAALARLTQLAAVSPLAHLIPTPPDPRTAHLAPVRPAPPPTPIPPLVLARAAETSRKAAAQLLRLIDHPQSTRSTSRKSPAQQSSSSTNSASNPDSGPVYGSGTSAVPPTCEALGASRCEPPAAPDSSATRPDPSNSRIILTRSRGAPLDSSPL